MPTAKQKRRLTPSNSLVVGTTGGVALAPLLVAGLTAAGIPITPELAAAIAPALAAVFSYFTRGGRKDEPQ